MGNMIIVPATLLHVYESKWTYMCNESVKAPMSNVYDVHEDYVLPPSTAASLPTPLSYLKGAAQT